MPQQSLPMCKIPDGLRSTAAGMSSPALRLGQRRSGIGWPLPEELTSEALEVRLFPASMASAKTNRGGLPLTGRRSVASCVGGALGRVAGDGDGIAASVNSSGVGSRAGGNALRPSPNHSIGSSHLPPVPKVLYTRM